jgi:succinyl-diaminopimelate desuccinylase
VSDPELAERLASITLELVGIPSESGEEAAVLSRIRAEMPSSGFFERAEDQDAVLFYVPEVRRPETPFVVLAGHVDTVPAAGTRPGLQEGVVVGRGAADMKGALAVMVESARALARGELTSDLDVGFLFFGREELPITQSALLPFFERNALARTIDLAIVMEPTNNDLEVGCLGNLNARILVHGAAAHSARPWLGENAIHTAIRALAPLADLPIRDVEIDGLIFREVVSVTTIAGGVAANVVPDHVEAHVNMRYAPTHAPPEAEARLRELLGAHRVEIDIVGNAPPGPVNLANPLVTRLRRAGDLRVGAKQAWTPVAEFAVVGVDAVNLGPGDPQYAHRDDERVEVASLVRTDELLRAFLTGAAGG